VEQVDDFIDLPFEDVGGSLGEGASTSHHTLLVIASRSFPLSDRASSVSRAPTRAVTSPFNSSVLMSLSDSPCVTSTN